MTQTADSGNNPTAKPSDTFTAPESAVSLKPPVMRTFPTKEPKRRIPRKVREKPLKPNWEQFLRLYCDPNSKGFSNALECTRIMGLNYKQGYYILNRIKKTQNIAAIEIFKEFGFTKFHWVKRIIDAANSNDELGNPTPVAVKALQMYGHLAGESVSEKIAAQNTTNVFNAPTMMVFGANDERFKKLEAGSIDVEAEDAES